MSGERTFVISCRSVLDLVNDSRSFVGAVTDVTSTVTLRERAEHDPLTGLLNRLTIEERLAAAVADHPDRTTVVFIDVDGFKEINDSYGHHVGDQVLVALAQRLRACVRVDDLVGRYGGDEFVLVLADSRTDVESIASRLERGLTEPIRWDGGSWRPAVSIGLARPRPGDDPATLLRSADREMFANKRLRKLHLVPDGERRAAPR